MHSRIFQVSTEPVGKKDFITECDFYDHWFVHSIADYVSDDVDREDDIEQLMEFIGAPKQAALEDGCFEIAAQVKEAYFKDMFENFIAASRDLFLMPFSEFMSSKGNIKICNLKNYHCDKYGFYIYNESSTLVPLDTFMRDIEPDTLYYLGGVVDYHF